MTNLAALLARRHPDYTGPLGVSWWRLVRDAVGGRGGFRHAVDHGRTDSSALGDHVQMQEAPLAGSYLRRFLRETAQAFAERQRTSFYRNHLSTIVRQYQGHLWRRAPDRQSTIATVADWWTDVDGAGTPIARWLAEGSRRAQHFGWCAALFDRDAGPQSIASARTTARWLQPEELVDWSFGEDGELEWARLCTTTITRSPFEDTSTSEQVYTTWTRKEWKRHVVIDGKVQGSLGTTDGAPHSLGAVPIALLYWQPPEEPGVLYGTSHLDSAIAAALELYNVSSEARHVERVTAFPILYIQSVSPTALDGLALGANAGLVVEPNVTMAPGFIVPPDGLNTHFAERRSELRDEVYRSANLDPPQADGTTPESGIARAYKFLPRRSVLVDVCEQLATFERDAVSILARWDGADPSAWQAATSVAYPSDFDVQDSDGVIERSVVVLQGSDVPVTKRAARVQLGRALAPHASATDEAALAEEAEALYQRELSTLNAPKAPTAELNSFNSPWAKGNEIRATMGLPAVPEGEVIPAIEAMKVAASKPDPAASGARDPARTTGANGGGNGPAAGA